MEIGFGMGEATALVGRDFPDVGFLAVEVHFPGVGKLMARIEELGLEQYSHHGDRCPHSL